MLARLGSGAVSLTGMGCASAAIRARSRSLCCTSPFNDSCIAAKRVDEAVVGGAVPLIHRHDVAVNGIETLRRARFAEASLADEARRPRARPCSPPAPSGPGRPRCARSAAELAFDRANAGDVLLDAPKLLAHIGNLPFKMLQILKLRASARAPPRSAPDLLHARVQRLDRRGRASPRRSSARAAAPSRSGAGRDRHAPRPRAGSSKDGRGIAWCVAGSEAEGGRGWLKDCGRRGQRRCEPSGSARRGRLTRREPPPSLASLARSSSPFGLLRLLQPAARGRSAGCRSRSSVSVSSAYAKGIGDARRSARHGRAAHAARRAPRA